MKKHFLLLALAAICSLSVWAQTERPFVSNLTGTPSESVQSLSASLSWTYNVPFDLSGFGGGFTRGYGSCSVSGPDANGILTLTYSSNGTSSYGAPQKNGVYRSYVNSVSFEAKSDNVDKNPSIVLYSWSDDAGADRVSTHADISSTWEEKILSLRYRFNDAYPYATDGTDLDLFGANSMQCINFLPIAANGVTNGKTYIRNAYFQLSSRAGVTSTVKIVRKNGSEPTSDTDGTVLSFNGNETTFTDNQDLLEGQTYYYRVFGTYNGVAYQSNAISVTMPGTPKIDPQLSFGLATKSLTKDATFNKPVSFVSGFDKTKVVYTSSNTGVAEIDANGLVTAKAVGTTTISAHSDAYEGYAVGNASYTLTVIELPIVSNLQIVNPENNIVPITFNIPGIVDLSKPIAPTAQNNGTVDSYTYDESNNVVTAKGTAPNCDQFGVAFNVSATNVETVSFEYTGEVDGVVNLWAGVCNGGTAYWQFTNDQSTTHPEKNTWKASTVTPNCIYWGPYENNKVPNPIAQINQVAIYANSGNGEKSNQIFSVRNVRYHVKDAVGVDHVVITRRLSTQGEDAAVQLYSGTKSAFTDNTITVAGTYVYTVYCEDKDGNRSAGATINYQYTPATAYSVTYTIGEDVTGAVPTEPDHIAKATFKVKAGTNLKRQGYTFAGWSDGTKTYQVDDDYTMPENNVVFAAQWEEKIVSPVTNFTATGIHKDVTLTWQMPATSKRIPVDLSSTTKREGQGGNFTVLSKESNLATISYNATGDWTYIYVHVPLGQTLTNFETITLDYKGNGSSAAVCYPYGGLEDYKWYNTECNFGNTDWQTMSSTPTTALHFGGTYTHTIDAIGFAISGGNAPAGVVSFRNVILTLSEGEWIEGMKLLRKADSAPTGPTDADATEISLEGLALTCADVLPITQTEVTYHYALYTYDEEENYSTATTASYTFVPQQEYTVTYAAGGEDVIGEVPVDEMPKVEDSKFNLPAPGDLLKPYCQFNGWKSSDDDKVYAAGDKYTMPAKNVIFTAQWSEEIEGLRIPENTVRLNYANQSTSIPTATFKGETCIDLYNQNYVEWNVFITPGQYKIDYVTGTPSWGLEWRISILDPVSNTEIQYFNTEHRSGNQDVVIDEIGTLDWNLTSLTNGKLYKIRITNNWGGSQTKVAHIDFIPTITIDQSKEDNLIFDGKANVTLIRPLAEGMTNSICLPFALDREQIDDAFGTGAEVWALTSSTLSADNMTLDIEFDQVDEMAAGVPYLIQPGTGYDATVNPIFNEIEMSTTLTPVVHPNLDFIGTVQKSFVSVGFKDHLFVGSGNMVYYPTGSGDLNGMRAYFYIKYHPEEGVPVGVSARMILGKTTPTELRTLKVNDSVRKVMINGRIHIIRNGVTNDILGNIVK